ncbi:alpha/beta fold hydrolase [Plantactinospora soyae]|uniref:Pimeloyl-ACP methyl ester carboxylesterase n=1 Tax=Plantactinospora soyae TaxID=1544732 RepID=A0A927R7E4_9ACTN|nr:alpha/beta hydrolase [Plantactinospora soyae]MBE1487771.1 pimeloyl-ACP methyl ester carboxylesterase [Plantactinospora soyae]
MNPSDTRTIGRRAAAVVAAAGLAGTLLAVVAPPASAGQHAPPVTWQSCPAYSDQTLALLAPPDKQPQLRELLGRLECGTVSVPLDYGRPNGRKITVALSRLKARDQAHRLGSLALNPGGPGGSGYLMPVEVILRGESTAGLNERYDLIGFDPRGVGYSTKVDCPAPDEMPDPPPPGPLTEDHARRIYDAQVAANAACGRSDPPFLGQLTTANVARDLDRIRAGLGEPRLNFLGISWGTWLGVVYRTLYPQQVGRMFLDSVAIPRFSIPAFVQGRADAAERKAGRMTAWLSEYDDTYGLGTTAAEVRETIIALRADYDANPRRFTDLPEPLDGGLIADAAGQDSPVWPLVGQILKELREATGPTAPPTVKQVLGGSGPPPPAPPADAPERSNRTMNKAAFCNEDPSRSDFASAWAAYRRNLTHNPMTGRSVNFAAGCAGWPLPVQAFRIKPGGGSLVLSGHRWEVPSPYEWTLQTRDIAGGKVYTVDDDVHGSALMECTADLVGFFNTGRIDGGCDGVPVPTGPAAAAAAFSSS